MANLGLLFILYIGKKTLFGLISAKYDKLGRAAALFSLLYLIFVANYSFILYREKDNYCVFILFSIGENTKLSVYHREKKGTKDALSLIISYSLLLPYILFSYIFLYYLIFIYLCI